MPAVDAKRAGFDIRGGRGVGTAGVRFRTDVQALHRRDFVEIGAVGPALFELFRAQANRLVALEYVFVYRAVRRDHAQLVSGSRMFCAKQKSVFRGELWLGRHGGGGQEGDADRPGERGVAK